MSRGGSPRLGAPGAPPRPMRKLVKNNLQIGDLVVVTDQFPDGYGFFSRRVSSASGPTG